ncbi:MAG: hypothetical protein JSR71_04575 [Proteobacteria bacterium]|nr:hypothetical protein [Pseudomonadota bacterium]
MEHAGLVQLLASLRVHLNDAIVSSPDLMEPAKPVQSIQSFVQSLRTLDQTFRNKLKSGGEGSLMVVIPAGRYVAVPGVISSSGIYAQLVEFCVALRKPEVT